MSFRGETMGTYYSITAKSNSTNLQNGVDSVLSAFESIFSTYDPSSLISGLNASDEDLYCLPDRLGHFANVLSVSKEAYENTEGAFDPTVMPLVRYWGFSNEKIKRSDFDSLVIDSLLTIVGFDKLKWESNVKNELCFHRSVSSVSLDLSAVAKGYGVDVLATWFKELGITDFMIEIGGEIVARGKNARQQWWMIGIEKPNSTTDISQREKHAIVAIQDMAIASSGNYRNFYELNGKLIGHTIDPVSGMPEVNDLLSVSVTASDCAYADALATGFMALGYKRSMAIADSLPGIEALFIHLDSSGNTILSEMTPGFSDLIVDGI